MKSPPGSGRAILFPLTGQDEQTETLAYVTPMTIVGEGHIAWGGCVYEYDHYYRRKVW